MAMYRVALLKAFVPLASLGVLVETVQPVPNTLVDAAGKLSIDLILIAAIITIWKELRAERDRTKAKDEEVVKMAVQATTAFTNMQAAFSVMQSTLQELKHRIDDVGDSVEDIRIDRGIISVTESRKSDPRRKKHE